MTADQINSQSLVDAARDALKCMERWSGVCNTDDYFGTMQRLRIALDGVTEPLLSDPARPTMSMFATAADYNAAMDEWLRARGVPAPGEALPADVFTVNFVRLAGLTKHKARECEEIVRTVLAARGVGASGLRDAAQQALDALELHGKQYPHMVKGYCVDAITVLRAALSTAGVDVSQNGREKNHG
jgi:hypothetical protein